MSIKNINLLGQEEARNEVVTVNAATEAEISPPKNRKFVYMRNTSTAGQVISITLSNTVPAAAGTGIVLNAGEAVTFSDSENFLCWTGKIRAISNAIGGTLSVVEEWQ